MRDRWELNRTGSRNLAFAQGALIGWAAGWALHAFVDPFITRQIFVIVLTRSAPPDWFYLAQAASEMLVPLGILIGGFWARGRIPSIPRLFSSETQRQNRVKRVS